LIACSFIQNKIFLTKQAFPLKVEVIDPGNFIIVGIPFLIEITLPFNN
jgi:hypothetical protein